MWWIKDNPDHSRGGFQNRDVGKSLFDDNYGPDFGIDYARFADPPDISRDTRLLESVNNKLTAEFADKIYRFSLIVRNGFIIIKGRVDHPSVREQIAKEIRLIDGVKEVINQLLVSHH